MVQRFDIPEALAHAQGWAAAWGIRRVPRGTRSSTQQPSSPHPNQPTPGGRYTESEKEKDPEPAKMSRSPERISSYRRHFEECTTSSSSTALQVRVSSPSPARRQQRAASYSRSAVASAANGMAMGRRAISSSRKPLMAR